MMNDAIERTREHLAQLGALLFERKLTDVAGGNMSVRVGDYICMTPRYAGSKDHWRLTPNRVLVVDIDGNVLDGDGTISREAGVHLRLHKDFGNHGTAVVHAHAQNILVFCAASQPMLPVLEATLKFGTIPVSQYAPSHTPHIADYVADAMRGQEARIREQAAGVIAPYHGIFAMGKDLDATFDAVERMDTNAYCILQNGGIGKMESLAARVAAAVGAYQRDHS